MAFGSRVETTAAPARPEVATPPSGTKSPPAWTCVANEHIAVAKKTAVATRCDVEMLCILLNIRFIVLIVFIFDSNSNANHET